MFFFELFLLKASLLGYYALFRAKDKGSLTASLLDYYALFVGLRLRGHSVMVVIFAQGWKIRSACLPISGFAIDTTQEPHLIN